MRIVFVCTTNVWGSAMAELISRQLLADWDPDREKVEVLSVGVRAKVGEPMQPVAQQILAERGIDACGHRARWMSPAVISDADLTLTMAVAQRDAVLALNPLGLRSTFTVREAVALLQSCSRAVPPNEPHLNRGPRALVEELSGARRFRSTSAGADDLPDLGTTDAPSLRQMIADLSSDVSILLRALTSSGIEMGTASAQHPFTTTTPTTVDA